MKEVFQKMLYAARAVERRRPFQIGCLVIVAAFAMYRMPLSPNNLFKTALEYHTRPYAGYQMLTVYSHLQGRPTETCNAFQARHGEAVQKIVVELGELSKWPNPVQFVELLIVYNREMRAFFLGPRIADCWQNFSYFGYFQSHFSTDAPTLWLFDIGLSTIYLALAFMIGAYASAFCTFFLAARISGSRWVGLVSVFLTLFAWRYLPGGHPVAGKLQTTLDNVFVSMYFAVLLPSLFPGKGSGAKQILLFVAALGAFVLHSQLSTHIYPFTHKVNGAFVWITIIAVGILRLRWRTIVAGVLAGILLTAWGWALDRHANRFYTQVTTYNQAANGAFGAISPIVGLFERPNRMGLPPCDCVFTRLFHYDAFVEATEPYMGVHQSLAYVGRDLFVRIHKEAPLSYLEAVWKRLYDQVFLHRLLFKEHYAQKGASQVPFVVVSITPLFLFMIGALIWQRRKLGNLALPVIILGLWHMFGIHTLFYVLHSSSLYYSLSGFQIFFVFAPPFLYLLIRRRASLRAAARRCANAAVREVDRAKASLRRYRPPRVLFVCAAAASLAVYFVVESRRETQAVRIWQMVHKDPFIPPAAGVRIPTPADFEAALVKLNELGEPEPGANEMFVAFTLWTYAGQNKLYEWRVTDAGGKVKNEPEEQLKLKAKAESAMLEMFRTALKKAPDNPHFPSFAKMIGDPGWPEVFQRAVERWPRDPYAAYMNWTLSQQAGTPEEKTRYMRAFETASGDLLSRTASTRVGYQRIPAIAGAKAGPVGMDGMRIELKSGEQLDFPDVETKSGDSALLSLFVRVESGKGRIDFVGRRPDGAESICASVDVHPGDSVNYRPLRCQTSARFKSVWIRISASEKGFSATIRDYYPMFPVIRIPSIVWRRIHS